MPFPARVISQEWEVPAPVSRVWEVLGQTDRLNRESGLPRIQVGAFEDEGMGRRVDARLYRLLPMSWIEYPFEWERNRSYVVQRRYSSGILQQFRGGVEVQPAPSGFRGAEWTRVRIFAEIIPRNLLGWLAIPVIAWDGFRRARAYCNTALRGADATAPGPAARWSVATPPDAGLLARRAARLEQLPSLDQRIVAALVRHVAEAGDDDVLRMQPYALAARWRTDPHETLRVCLHATRAGVLSLAWELLCPNCRVPKTESETLSAVTSRFHCDTCGIAYDANLDRYVELRFRCHPGIRPVQGQVYCFGGPYSAPHILVQHLLWPGESRDVTMPLDGEPYRIRTLRRNEVSLLRPGASPSSGGSAHIAIAYREDGWERAEQPFAPGPVTLRWTNRSAKVIGVVLERLRWDELAVTAARVTTLQEFRDLFGSEVLTPGQEIGIESVTILFTDLKESTRLYEEAGDAPAYGHVRRHFDFIKERVVRHQGALVKTIGDAVMAVFHEPADALRCGLEIQRDLGAFNSAVAERKPLVVKMGVHHGPAIAINANGRLDFFGRTVNIASRILRESRGGDLVLAKELLDEPQMQIVLQEEKAVVAAEWTPILRGLTEPLTVCRVCPA